MLFLFVHNLRLWRALSSKTDEMTVKTLIYKTSMYRTLSSGHLSIADIIFRSQFIYLLGTDQEVTYNNR